MTQSQLRVLCAPACRTWQREPVSEDGWLPTVFEHLLDAGKVSRVTALVEATEVPSSPALRLVAVGKRRSELGGSATLPIKVGFVVASKDLMRDVDLVHVGLPFAIGWSQSALLPMVAHRRLPLVVGPVQVLQTWMAPDEIRSRQELLSSPRTQAPRARRLADRVASSAYGWARPALRAGNRRLLRAADVVVAVSEAAASLVRAEGVENERIRVVPHPLSCSPAPRRLTQPMAAPRLLAVGVLIERKAVDVTLSALRHLRVSGRPATLVIAGQGPQEASLRRLAEELGVQDLVEFTGWLGKEQLVEEMSRATAFVTMSRSEAFPVAVIDAMAAGLPVVSAANTGARSVIEPGATGWLVPVDDELALAERLHWILAHPAEAAGVADRARRWARETLAPPVVADRWGEVYDIARSVNRAQRTNGQGGPDLLASFEGLHPRNQHPTGRTE